MGNLRNAYRILVRFLNKENDFEEADGNINNSGYKPGPWDMDWLLILNTDSASKTYL
jgi:hypothetical protein